MGVNANELGELARGLTECVLLLGEVIHGSTNFVGLLEFRGFLGSFLELLFLLGGDLTDLLVKFPLSILDGCVKLIFGSLLLGGDEVFSLLTALLELGGSLISSFSCCLLVIKLSFLLVLIEAFLFVGDLFSELISLDVFAGGSFNEHHLF